MGLASSENEYWHDVDEDSNENRWSENFEHFSKESLVNVTGLMKWNEKVELNIIINTNFEGGNQIGGSMHGNDDLDDEGFITNACTVLFLTCIAFAKSKSYCYDANVRILINLFSVYNF